METTLSTWSFFSRHLAREFYWSMKENDIIFEAFLR
jgi:hypothetical protein